VIKGTKHSEETRKKLCENHVGTLGKHPSKETRHKMSLAKSGENNPLFGKRHSKETRKKMSENNVGNKGKHLSEETRRKMRLAALNRIEKLHGPVYPNYNPSACTLIEEYGKANGYLFQHAENGGEYHIPELGYWVDGYDKEKNVVIEVYEPFHRRTSTRDAARKGEITKHLGCEFIVLHTYK
jgi:hypothetical protein